MSDLDGNLGGRAIKDMAFLRTLFLHNNPNLAGTTIPQAFSQIPKLSQITLYGTGLAGTVPRALPKSLTLCALADQSSASSATGVPTNFSCPLPPDLPAACLATTVCQCPPGTSFYGVGTNFDCSPCPAGTAKSDWSAAAQCSPCAPGTVSSAGGA